MTRAAPEPFDGEEREVWRGLIRISLNLPRLVDADMQEVAGLSLADFSVLVQLYRSSTALRVTEIARRVGLSLSRVSRAITSLDTRGLIRRIPCESDGRGAMITLEAAGTDAVRRALPAQAARAAQLIPALVFDEDTPGGWLNRIADRIDAESTTPALPTVASPDPSPQALAGNGADTTAADSPDPCPVTWPDNLTTLRTELDRAGSAALRGNDLTSNAFAVMDLLGTSPRSTAALARALNLTAAGVTKILHRLQARDWVYRSPDPIDTRASTVHLTPPGKEALTRIREKRATELNHSLATRLDPADIAELSRILGALS